LIEFWFINFLNPIKKSFSVRKYIVEEKIFLFPLLLGLPLSCFAGRGIVHRRICGASYLNLEQNTSPSLPKEKRLKMKGKRGKEGPSIRFRSPPPTPIYDSFIEDRKKWEVGKGGIPIYDFLLTYLS